MILDVILNVQTADISCIYRSSPILFVTMNFDIYLLYVWDMLKVIMFLLLLYADVIMCFDRQNRFIYYYLVLNG